MNHQPQTESGPRGAAAATKLFGIISADVAMAVGAWLLCLTGLMSLFTPSTLPSAAVLRLALVGTGFALYGYGRTQKQRNALAHVGASETQLVRGLGGWLIALAVLIGITLVSAIIQAVHDIPVIADGKTWAAYTTSGSPAYHPGWALLLVLDWGGNLFVLVFFPVLLSLFLQRKRLFRPLTIATLVLLAALSAVHLWQVNHVPHIPDAAQASQFWALLLTCGNAAIWIPYLLQSKRARVTFDQ